MSGTALYQKYRSQTFDEVVGQEYVVRSIKNAVREGKVGHAYLFCGPRGTGKTTMARLLAKAVTCENPEEAPCGHCPSCMAAAAGNHPDIIEINAANETHVEDVRDLIERSRLAPMMSMHKVYIIDEVHQLSSSAASALLKTLEEPPEHVIFILATTDPQKLINTIISRCQRFDFTKVPTEKIKDHLLKVAAGEKMSLEENAARKIAELADGGMRDALSILEQVSSYSGGVITEADINTVYGLASTQQLIDMLECIFNGDIAGIIKKIQDYEYAGMDLKELTSGLIVCLKDAVIWHCTKKEDLLRLLTSDEASAIAQRAVPDQLLKMTDRLMDAAVLYRSGQSIASVLEIACMELAVHAGPAEEKEPVKKRTISGPEHDHEAELARSTAPSPEQPAELPVRADHEQEPPCEKTVSEITEPPLMDADRLVGLLVQCDKESKAADAVIIQTLSEGIPTDRYAAILHQAELKASGPDCILFGCDSEAAANMINEQAFNREFYFWLKMNGIDRMPFAASTDLYGEAVKEFMRLRKTDELPGPLPISRYIIIKEEKETKEDPLAKAQALFGGPIEVVKGDQ